MKTLLSIIMLLMLQLTAAAQASLSWEELFYDMMSAAEDDDVAANWAVAYETLSALADAPMDINTATRQDLEQLPFLTAQQLDDIEEYRYRYGPMKSLGELLMIPSITPLCRELLSHFVTIGAAQPLGQRRLPKLADALSTAKQQLTAYSHVPFFTRRGDRNGYLGYRYKHWLQYDYSSCGGRIRAGLVAAQDAGEPFLSNKNTMGYDYYSYFLQLRQMGRVENLVLGKYKVSAGMGLVFSTGFSLGKLAMLQSLARTTATLRPHASRSVADYLQGAAATVRLSSRLSTTAFASYRAIDATLNANGEAATLVTSGYHRTPTEISKKNNTHAAATGLRLAYSHGGIHIGANAVYTHLDRRLQPNVKTLYRRYYPQGTNFVNASVDYSLQRHRLAINGETAIDGHGAVATLNSASFRATDALTLLALHRFYSYRYQSLYAHALSEGGRVQNESGVMAGATWQPSPQLRLQAYADYAQSPWLRYQVSQPGSTASDYFVSLTYSRTLWSLEGRYRLHLRQRDNTQKSALIDCREQRARLLLTLSPTANFTSTTQADLSDISYKHHGQGYALSQRLGYTGKWFSASAAFSYFNTTTTDCRIYLYERAPLYTFAFSSFSGQGIRYSAMLRAGIGRKLTLTAKVGIINYFDRNTIGTGYQQTEGSSQTALDLQCRWRF